MNIDKKLNHIVNLPFLVPERVYKRVSERAMYFALGITVIFSLIILSFSVFDLGQVFAIAVGVHMVISLILSYLYFYRHDQRRKKIAELRNLRFAELQIKHPPFHIPNITTDAYLRQVMSNQAKKEAVEGVHGEDEPF